MRKILGYFVDPRGDGSIETLCEGIPAQSNQTEYAHWRIETVDDVKKVLLLVKTETGEFMVDEECVLWDNYFELQECIRVGDCCLCCF